MKKFSLIAILFILTVATTIPYWTGLITEQQISLFDQSVNDLLGFEPTTHSYQRGWFQSSAQSNFNVSSPSTTTKYHLTLLHQINHGFLPLKPTTIDTILRSDPPLCIPQPFKIQTVFQADGETAYFFNAPHCYFKQGIVQLQSQKLQGEVRFNRDFKIKNILSQTELAPDLADFMPITTEFALAELQLSNQSRLAVKLTDIQLRGKITLDQEDTLTITLITSLLSMMTDDQKYGPGFLDLELRRGYAPAIKEMMNTLINIFHSNLPPYQRKMTLLGVVMRHGATLLSYHPELIIRRFSVAADEGLLQGTLQVSVEATENQFNPFQLLKWIKVEGDITTSLPRLRRLITQSFKILFQKTIPKDQLKQHMDHWLVQGILKQVEKSENYQLKFDLKQGQLVINGQPVPLTALLLR
ncbi:MAG: hypothetical protein BWK79_07130 [Beggiatoa sp. IS2]|nr:MAG: hypothetical protein BWK79_07130 [Beggiatoa sp. IS2]